MKQPILSKGNVVVVGASAGGVEALTKLVAQLPPDLSAALFVVLHISAHSTSVLPEILTRAGVLKATHAEDGEVIEPGRIYVAPPDRHLLIESGQVKVVRGPRENGHRPAIDPLFRTAARTYGPQVIGVVLSGVLDDGTAGLCAIKQRGGIGLVQHPDEAMFDGMVRSAIENVEVDAILPVSDIAAELVRLATQPLEVPEIPLGSEKIEVESEIAELNPMALHKHERLGKPSGFACPDCGGVLWELEEGNLIRFRCRVGHAFSTQTLLAHQSDVLEEALWTAFRALEESASLNRRMAKRAFQSGHDRSGKRYEEQAQDAKKRADLIRQALANGIAHSENKGIDRDLESQSDAS